MSLKDEIRQLLASFNVPEDVAALIAALHQDLEREQIAPGIEVGAAAPDFELPDSAGDSVRLHDRLAEGPVVLSFFRGAWCPICNLQLAALRRAFPEIRRLGAAVLAVRPDAGQILESPPEGFLILSDTDQSVIRNYRLQFTLPPRIQQIYPGTFGADVSMHNANGSWSLPVPATFVIDQQGVVQRRHVRADFAERMEPSEVIAALESLRNQVAS